MSLIYSGAFSSEAPEVVNKRYRPVVLVILDGWGINTEIEGNAIANSKTPIFNFLKGNYPCVALQASGISVGLAWGEPGNSEVGHMTIGSGMIMYQNLPRINLAIQNGSFFSSTAIIDTMNRAKMKGSALHFLGLVSNGGVHSHIDHLFALLELAVSRGNNKIFVHVITDGRDTLTQAGAGFVKSLEEKLQSLGAGKIASISGRNWTMDRNQNWDRIEKGYDAIMGDCPNKAKSSAEVIAEAYKQNLSDEFIEPHVIIDEMGTPVGSLQKGDSLIFFNFREDRARQITTALTDPAFSGFKRKRIAEDVEVLTMVEYESNLKVKVAFPPQKIESSLSKILSENNKTQFHIAETEKYAHVTYFFNGGIEEPYPGEERTLVPSPQVNSYEQTPEMSAAGITEKLLARMATQKDDFILVNYSNADMIGHTGNFEAAKKAVETVDFCLGKVLKAGLPLGACFLVTADHGNAEFMKDIKTGEKVTEHTNNPVPLFFVTPDNKKERTEAQIMRHQNMVDGMLVDIAPTVLELLNIPVPTDMVGSSLLKVLK